VASNVRRVKPETADATIKIHAPLDRLAHQARRVPTENRAPTDARANLELLVLEQDTNAHRRLAAALNAPMVRKGQQALLGQLALLDQKEALDRKAATANLAAARLAQPALLAQPEQTETQVPKATTAPMRNLAAKAVRAQLVKKVDQAPLVRKATMVLLERLDQLVDLGLQAQPVDLETLPEKDQAAHPVPVARTVPMASTAHARTAKRRHKLHDHHYRPTESSPAYRDIVICFATLVLLTVSATKYDFRFHV